MPGGSRGETVCDSSPHSRHRLSHSPDSFRRVGKTGGIAAASGLFYQYLFTIETLFGLVNDGWPEAAKVVIEDPDDAHFNDPDVVDFSVYHPTRGLVAVYQAKSVARPNTSTISAAAAIPSLIRMADSADSPDYTLISNARPGVHIDRLNALLRGDLPDARLLDELAVLVKDSARALQALDTIDSPEVITRLRRAQVRATGESAEKIRSRMSGDIAQWRVEHTLPTGGARAARILENSLIAQIFSRAAEADSAVGETIDGGRSVTVAAFAELLAEPEYVLARAAALVEAGEGIHRVPSSRGIDRPDEFAKIVGRFNNIRSRRVRMCALTGASGIGKTRLAAMYAVREHRSYDRVVWIDAESDTSITTSVLRQARGIGIPEHCSGDLDEITDAFKRSISRFIGRWLIVFDNAQSSRQLQRWITPAGHADILVTSTNSVDWTQYDPVPIKGLEASQAHQLLRSRLAKDMERASPQRREQADAALALLARRLEYRPLALELAAAHFETLSNVVEHLDTYLANIEDFVCVIADDPTLNADGYPHTLQAAVSICLDRLVAAAADDPVSATALRMMLASSVVASRRIPQALLYAIASEPPPLHAMEPELPTTLRGQMPRIHAAVRRIRTQSLIDRDDEPDAGLPWELQHHVNVNEIVQFVIRERSVMAEALNDTAAHISSWLARYIDGQHFSCAAALQPHASAVLSHATHTDGLQVSCATLAGNQATLLDLLGRSSEARSWLEFEYRLLERLPEPAHHLMAKTASQLVQAMLHQGSTVSEVRAYLICAVTHLESGAKTMAADWRGSMECLNLLSAITALEVQGQRDGVSAGEIRQFRERILRVQTAFPMTRQARRHAQILELENNLEQGNFPQAVSQAEDLLRSVEPNDHLQRIHLKLQLMQASASVLIADETRIASLQTIVADFESELQRHPEIVTGVAQALINSCVSIEIYLIHVGGPAPVLAEAVRRIVRFTNMLWANAYDRYCRTVLAACETTRNNDLNGVRFLLNLAAEQKPAQYPGYVGRRSNAAMLTPWLEHWAECTENGLPARGVVCPAVYSPERDAVIVHIDRPDLAAEFARKPGGPGKYEATWQTDVLGCSHALNVRLANGDKHVALLPLPGDCTRSTSDHCSCMAHQLVILVSARNLPWGRAVLKIRDE